MKQEFEVDVIKGMVDALKELIFLSQCELEGLSSGQPSAEQWRKAFEKAEKALIKSGYMDEPQKTNKNHSFKEWIKEVTELDKEQKFLLEYEEIMEWQEWYSKGITPEKAVNLNYHNYG